MTVPQARNDLAYAVTRDVQEELAQQRREKRRGAGGVSPVQYHKDLLLGDDWNCMFLNQLCQGVSLHRYDEPPEHVLDIGCGSGLWAIEAAKQWPNARIVGYDQRDIQPDLTQLNLGIEVRDLSQRVRWEHGDFLDPLPFESNYFNHIHICGIGLEVPEDSWQELLEECARVLAVGGQLEVLEEDPLFPAGKTLLDTTDKSSFNTSMRGPDGQRIRTDSTATNFTTMSNMTTATTSTSRTDHSVASSSNIQFTTEHIAPSSSIGSYVSTSSTVDSADSMFAQDHEKLKRAWEAMLDHRFICHRLTNVLPLYLSSFFKNIEVHPTLHVVLPLPSRDRVPDSLADREIELAGEALDEWTTNMKANTVQLNGESQRKSNTSTLRKRLSMSIVTTWNTLHLTRQLRLVTACKEAIWEAYRTLDDEPRSSVGVQQPRRDDLLEEFERDWFIWEMDMKDRIGIRNHVQDALLWQDPEIRSMRSHSLRSSGSLKIHYPTDPEKAPICRAIRAFSAGKAYGSFA
ncbi:S-adenosyl-L-methionine-dependent methyltransferase [Epithele typhae]|uniref:S-adenosyl-L-methionine-dependent methyltransferase n=1 Tax=Epithele typhae TaxID=378194 RepID=UPI00200783DB|nr:S-adenosyl-L-methionine-dependent methyltransferase [Epithele typhae]KAH9945153.1 S-adenosyl-L-methionine-dependent methyltransferase [Epithele typhae]